jgi:hypothetical protein
MTAPRPALNDSDDDALHQNSPKLAAFASRNAAGTVTRRPKIANDA